MRQPNLRFLDCHQTLINKSHNEFIQSSTARYQRWQHRYNEQLDAQIQQFPRKKKWHWWIWPRKGSWKLQSFNRVHSILILPIIIKKEEGTEWIIFSSPHKITSICIVTKRKAKLITIKCSKCRALRNAGSRASGQGRRTPHPHPTPNVSLHRKLIYLLPTSKKPAITKKGWYFVMIVAPVLQLFLSSQ